jgi:hypothetical protein
MRDGAQAVPDLPDCSVSRIDPVCASDGGFSVQDGSDRSSFVSLRVRVLLAWVETAMHRLEIGDGRPRVDLRGFNGRMAQHLLQIPDRRARPQRMGRTAVGKGACRHGSSMLAMRACLCTTCHTALGPMPRPNRLRNRWRFAIRT